MILNLLPGEIHEDENLCIEPVPHGSWIHATISQLSDPIAVNRNYLYKNTKVISKMLIHNRFLFLPLNHEMPKKNYLYGIIFTTRNNPSTVWSKPNCIYPSGMAFICVNATFPSYIPYFQISIQRTRCEEFTKWVEINWYTVWPVTG